MLVVGTESCQLVFLTPSGNEVRSQVKLQSVPV